ncbi:hypothetical protein PAXINDRAFT_169310 [Paxillus involutus ATCC 200175]|uniref:Uncharacterized protein n=1 Tax=Paxillus involutus ATCC 200175 TaxID=664439 RepID=A0A0C9TXZ5_PAXIN|nr:hypothetical protein PAXINDRAFT_169310 [Paxillus involutus ATCC 200175]
MAAPIQLHRRILTTGYSISGAKENQKSVQSTGSVQHVNILWACFPRTKVIYLISHERTPIDRCLSSGLVRSSIVCDGVTASLIPPFRCGKNVSSVQWSFISQLAGMKLPAHLSRRLSCNPANKRQSVPDP